MRTGTPKCKSEWIAEIAEAYRDAEEAIPFGPITGQLIEEKDLFHLAPAVCLKFTLALHKICNSYLLVFMLPPEAHRGSAADLVELHDLRSS